MVGGSVECVEAMVVTLDFRAVRDDKAQFAEASHDVLGDLRQGVEAPKRLAPAGQGEIGRFGRSGGLEFQRGGAFGEGGFERLFGDVERLACFRAFLAGQAAHALGQGGEAAFSAEILDARLLQGGEIVGRLQLRQRGLLQ